MSPNVPQLTDTRLEKEEDIFGFLVTDSLTISWEDGFFSETSVHDRLWVPRSIAEDQNSNHKNLARDVAKREVDFWR